MISLVCKRILQRRFSAALGIAQASLALPSFAREFFTLHSSFFTYLMVMVGTKWEESALVEMLFS